MPASDYGPMPSDTEEPLYVLLGNNQVLACGATRKKGAGRCKNTAGFQTDHPGIGRCKLHGGCTPAHEVTAARTEVAAKLDSMKRLGIINERVSPEEALLDEVARGAAAVAYFDQLVAEIADPTTVYGQILIEQWNEQRKLAKDTAKVVVRAGIARRAVEVQEMLATALVQVIMAVISSPEMDLDSEKQMIARRLMAFQLRQLSSTAIETSAAE